MEPYNELFTFQHLLSSEQNVILDLIKAINKHLFDRDKSFASIKNSNLIIEVYSHCGTYCPFALEFSLDGNKNQFVLYLHESSPIIEAELKADSLFDVVTEVTDILSNEVFEELTFFKNILIKAYYRYTVTICEKKVTLPHSTYRRFNWFWQKKQIERFVYKPWL